MKKIRKFIIHLLTIHLLVCTNLIQSASLTLTTTSNLSTNKDNQLNNRLLRNDKQFIMNYDFNQASIGESTINQSIDQTQINQPIKQPILIDQSIKHRDCGVQHLGTSRSSSLSSLNEFNLDSNILRSIKRDSNDYRHLTTNKNRSNYDYYRNHFNHNYSHLTSNNRKKNTRRGKVVGGEIAYDGEFPWTVSIRKMDQHHCGGVIISEFWILTAGHCVSSQSNIPSQYTIRIGEYNLYLPDINTIDYQVSKIIIHTNYTGLTSKRKSTKNADIALIRTKNPIVLGDYAWPICYFDSEEDEKQSLVELSRHTPSKVVKKSFPDKELNYGNNEFVEHQLTDDLIDDNYFSILDESNCESYNQLDLQILNNFGNSINDHQQSNYLDSTVSKDMSIRNRKTSLDNSINLSIDNSSIVNRINNSIQNLMNSPIKILTNISIDDSINGTTNNLIDKSFNSSAISFNQQSINFIKYPTTFQSFNLPSSDVISEDETNLLNKINVTKFSKITKLANLVIVVGWGKKHEKADQYSTYLQKSTLCLIPNSVCEHWYRSAGRSMNIPNELICAGWRSGGRDSCHGDSGGPLLAKINSRWYVLGVVSTGIGCARPLLPGLYSRVSSYSKWIEENIRNEDNLTKS